MFRLHFNQNTLSKPNHNIQSLDKLKESYVIGKTRKIEYQDYRP